MLDAKRDGLLHPLQGSAHPMATIDERLVRKLLAEYSASKPTLQALARKYAISRTVVGRIVHGLGWTHVDGHRSPAQPRTAWSEEEFALAASAYFSGATAVEAGALIRRTGAALRDVLKRLRLRKPKGAPTVIKTRWGGLCLRPQPTWRTGRWPGWL